MKTVLSNGCDGLQHKSTQAASVSIFFLPQHRASSEQCQRDSYLVPSGILRKRQSTISIQALVSTSGGVDETNAGSLAGFSSEAIKKGTLVIKGQSSPISSLKLRWVYK